MVRVFTDWRESVAELITARDAAKRRRQVAGAPIDAKALAALEKARRDEAATRERLLAVELEFCETVRAHRQEWSDTQARSVEDARERARTALVELDRALTRLAGEQAVQQGLSKWPMGGHVTGAEFQAVDARARERARTRARQLVETRGSHADMYRNPLTALASIGYLLDRDGS